MQRLSPTEERFRVLLFQPRWTPPGPGGERLSHCLIPILGALLDAGCELTLAEEAFDGTPASSPPSFWAAALDRVQLVIIWCSEMYPAYQILGLQNLLRGLQGRALPVIAGGGFFRVLDPRELAFPKEIRALVTGPGEQILPQLVQTLLAPEASAKTLQEIPGIAFHHRGQIRTTPPPKRRHLNPHWIQALSQLPLRRYANPAPHIFGNNKPSLQIHGGSGCAKRCPFCFDERNPYGVFPAQAVIDSISIVQEKAGIDQFAIGELDFFHRIPRALEIAQGLLPFRPRIRWFALGSVADIVRLQDQDLRLLKQSGCHRIELGSESGSDAQLERLGKRHKAANILEATARLRAHGIHSTHNLIFGSLGEEASDRRATFRLARKIGQLDPRSHLQFRLYQVVPGTSHGDRALRSMPWFPKSLDQLATFRLGLAQGQRSLPWLSEEDEDLLHKLTDYVLPLAFHRPHPSKHPLVQTFFRRLARARVRTGLQLGLGWEERLYRKAIGEPLLTTYLP